MSRTNTKHAPNDLIPNPHNARQHSDEQVGQIAKSIERFGWVRPVVVDEAKTILAGHGAVQAAQHLELKQIPTLTITGLTDDEKRAYVILDNKLTLNSWWDDEKLRAEISDLRSLDVGDLIGFTDKEIQVMFPEDVIGPPDFPIVDDTELNTKCPRCGYEFDVQNPKPQDDQTNGE